MKDDIMLRCQGVDYLQTFDFALLTRDYSQVAADVKMVKQEEHIRIEPTFSLNRTAAQLLLDDLWQTGIRPSEWKRVNTTDIDLHLADMRKIVSKNLKVKL
jgi:hypothetical protein